MFLEFSDWILSERVKFGLIDMVVNMIMQGLDLSVVHFLCPWCKGSIAVSKTADVGSNPSGHV